VIEGLVKPVDGLFTSREKKSTIHQIAPLSMSLKGAITAITT
jgi:hypothetical protein